MALVTQVIPSFNGGVSQQPDRSRFINQLTEQVNGLSNDVEGLQKRPPSCFRAKATLLDTEGFIRIINRDNEEQYLLSFGVSAIYPVVYDLEGNRKTVNGSTSYLDTDNPKRDLRCVTIADYTFLLNKSKIPQMMPKTSSTTNDGWALIYCKSANYGKTYSVTINGTYACAVLMPDGANTYDSKLTTTEKLADSIYNLLANGTNYIGGAPNSTSSTINAVDFNNRYNSNKDIVTQRNSAFSNSGLTIQRLGDSVVAIRYSDGRATPPNVVVKDGAGNTNMYVLLGSTTSTSKLPPIAPNGCVIKVQSEKGSDDSVYYLKYDSTLGNWVETLKGGIKYAIDPSSMPHALVRNSDGTFTVKQLSWTDRTVGDETTNSEPSFIGKKINDIFFFRNRLGFVADENVILSTSSDFFNFWFNSSATVVDTDPIDVSLSSNKVAIITDVIPFAKELFLFSQEGQFVLHSQGAMSPSTVAIDQVTAFRYSKNVKPITLGQSLFFVTQHTDSSSLMRFHTSQDLSETMDAEDVTAHCPSYLPTGITIMTGSTSENLVCMATGNDNTLYVYKYLNNGEKVIQQSVSKWTFGPSATTKVVHAEFVDSYLYVIVSRFGTANIERIVFTDNRKDFTDEPYRLFLDSKREFSGTLTYLPYADKTTAKISYDLWGAGDTYCFVRSDGYYETFTFTKNTTSVELSGDWSGESFWYGVPYTFDVTLSKCLIKTANEAGIDVLDNGKVQVRSFKVHYSKTGSFNVIVRNNEKGKEYTYVSTNKQLGTISSKTDSMNIADGTFKFPVQDCNTGVEIEIVSDTPQPITLVSGSFDALFVPRTRRM
jgi:hypothetical protein